VLRTLENTRFVPGVYGCGVGITLWCMKSYLMMKYRNKRSAVNKRWKYIVRDIETKTELQTGKPCEIGNVDAQ
jgi:hypothetical protein